MYYIRYLDDAQHPCSFVMLYHKEGWGVDWKWTSAHKNASTFSHSVAEHIVAFVSQDPETAMDPAKTRKYLKLVPLSESMMIGRVFTGKIGNDGMAELMIEKGYVHKWNNSKQKK